MRGRFWTPAEERALLDMVTLEGRSFEECDRALGRSHGASAQKFQRLPQIIAQVAPRSPSGHETRAIHAPKRVPLHGSLTAEVFGDPLPGRSALDRVGKSNEMRSISLSTGEAQ